MLNKLKMFWNLFRAGEAVADPAKWKAKQINGTMIAAILLCLVQLARAFNVEIPIDDETATAIGAGIVAVFNVIFTIVTSKSVGVSAAGIVRANEQVVPSVQQSNEQPAQTEAVQGGISTGMGHNSVDENVRKRAEQYVKQSTSNGLSNDA